MLMIMRQNAILCKNHVSWLKVKVKGHGKCLSIAHQYVLKDSNIAMIVTMAKDTHKGQVKWPRSHMKIK